MQKQTGYLLIADLTNYTAFLTKSDLEQGQLIITELFEAILTNMEPPLVVSKLEGDAVFAYAPQGAFLQGQTLLEAVEKVYTAFRRARDYLALNVCRSEVQVDLLMALDLKFALHHGEFLISEIGGRPEISGPAVILTHRLLKNSITPTTGVGAYAFLTGSATEAMALGDLTQGMMLHSERYDHLGEIWGYVHDLDAVWTALEPEPPLDINGDELWFRVETTLPISAALAWDYLHEPERKRIWSQSDTLYTDTVGRVGVGAAHICTHGDQSFEHTIVSWQPFSEAAFEVVGPFGSVIRYMTRVTQTQDGAHIEWLWARPTGGQSALHEALINLVTPAMRFFFEGPAYETAEILEHLITEDAKQGRVVLQPLGSLRA